MNTVSPNINSVDPADILSSGNAQSVPVEIEIPILEDSPESSSETQDSIQIPIEIIRSNDEITSMMLALAKTFYVENNIPFKLGRWIQSVDNFSDSIRLNRALALDDFGLVLSLSLRLSN